MFLKRICLILLIHLISSKFSAGSRGDQLNIYKQCLYDCKISICDTDEYSYVNSEKFSFWPCSDECKYECMWETVDKFEKSNLPIPQFHGKWPFLRILGIQEPASAIFSLFNLIIHFKWINVFRKEIPQTYPFWWLWHVFGIICSHAWFWSVVFHAKDTAFTEFMDYSGAFSIILVNFYVAVIRLMPFLGKFCYAVVSLFFIIFYLNHAQYLYTGKIDYNYNMILNISIAGITAMIWLIWCFLMRKQRDVSDCLIYVISTCSVALFEIIDRPPLLYIFDSHSIWHLATSFLIGRFYTFAMKDCRYLHKQQEEKSEGYRKNL